MLFTDDAKIGTPRSDFNILQQHLREAWRWTEAWALPPNADKHVHLSIDQHPAGPLSLHDDAPISTRENIKKRGVFGNTNFTPPLNSRLAVSRARARLFQIHRGFVVMTKKAFLPLCLGLVRPSLEYTIKAVSLYVQEDIGLTGRLKMLAARLGKCF